ncbi:MAG: aminofutalosine synthase MqnE, partial [Phycisphaerales bacterium JB039]
MATAAPEIPPATTDSDLEAIRTKIEAGQRLSLDDGDLLYRTPDIWTVVELADLVRRRLHGDVAYYNINRHLNYSNVCALRCAFCEFKRRKDEPGAYTRTLEDIRAEARKAV